jgi:hypothetical protein
MSSIYLYNLTFTLPIPPDPTNTGLFDQPSPSKTWYELTDPKVVAALEVRSPADHGQVPNLSGLLTSSKVVKPLSGPPSFSAGDKVYVQVAPSTGSHMPTSLTLVLAFGRANKNTLGASPFRGKTFFYAGQMATSGVPGICNFWVYYLGELNNVNVPKGETWTWDLIVDVDTGSGQFGNDPEMVVTNG